MATEAQVAANRRNAKKSTGPRTTEGKEKSSMNAMKTGLSAPGVRVVLPTEDLEEFEAFRDGLFAALEPVGALEERLATEVIECSWRLRRASNIEQGILAHGVADADEHFLGGNKRRFEITNADLTAARLRDSRIPHPDEVVEITDELLHEHLEMLIDEVLSAKRTEEGRLAAGFIEDAAGPNALAKLTRYETAIFRRRNQALAMLTTIQAARSAETKEDA
jgi:hypothetical protein